jgi:Erv1 / Alr family
MGPETWGPVLWEYAHVAAFHADAQRKPQAIVDRILDGFHASIPCPSCSDHFDDFRSKVTLDTTLEAKPSVTNFAHTNTTPTSTTSTSTTPTSTTPTSATPTSATQVDFPMLRWTIKAHNNVNKRNNKPLVDENQVVEHFRKTGTLLNSNKKACQDSASYYYYVCVVLGVLVVVLLGLLCLFALRNAKLKTLLRHRLREETSNKQRGDTLRTNKLGQP